jgi:hypothetical protein
MMYHNPDDLLAGGIGLDGCNCHGKQNPSTRYVPHYVPRYAVSGLAGYADGVIRRDLGEVTSSQVGSAALDVATTVMDNPADVKKIFAPIFALAEVASQSIPPPWGQIVSIVLGALEMGINRIGDNLAAGIQSIPTHVPALYAVPAMEWVKKNVPMLFLEAAKDFVADRAGSYLPSEIPGGFNPKTSSRVAYQLYNKLTSLGANPADAAIVAYRCCSGDQSNPKDNRPWDPPAALAFAKVIAPTAADSFYKNRQKIEQLWAANAESRGVQSASPADWKKAGKNNPKTAAGLKETAGDDNTALYLGAAALVGVILLTRK